MEDHEKRRKFRLEEFNKHNQMNGVCIFLHRKGLKNAEDQHYIIKLYVVYMKWEIPAEKPVLEACVKIQKDFRSFVEWFHDNDTLKDLVL